jgi:hypothetical protein
MRTLTGKGRRQAGVTPFRSSFFVRSETLLLEESELNCPQSTFSVPGQNRFL